LVKGIGPVRFRQLLSAFGTLQAAWEAPDVALREAGLDRRALRSLKEARQRISPAAELARLDHLGIAVLTWEDELYPPLLGSLRGIDHAAPVLYLRGTLDPADDWAVAVVGTRSVSAYGRQVTHQIAGELAANGLTIVSGLARGVDAESHQAALGAGARTIAVLACGLDAIYPPEHRQLAARIIQQGALISPFPLGTDPVGGNFSARNRVMSGLARGVIVTEAGDKSGALITAGHALEQGREVFAVPGNITAHNSAGTNRLIQDGAHPVLSAQDVLDVLNLERVADFTQARRVLPDMTPDEQAVLSHLSPDPAHIDEIVATAGLPAAVVGSALVTLELKGLARSVGGMMYVRA
jgi:DNA processing protein